MGGNMTTIKGMNISVSRGDTLKVLFKIEGLELCESDIVTFALKGMHGTITQKSVTGLIGNKIFITLLSMITKSIPPVTFYDITITNAAGVVKTISSPAKITVIGVAHDVYSLPYDLQIRMEKGGNEEVPSITIEVPPDWSILERYRNAIVDILGADDKLTVTRVSGESSNIVINNVSAAKRVGNLSGVKRSTAYNVGDVAYTKNIPSWGYLECYQAGVTAASVPKYPVTENGLASDGTVVWQLRKVANTAIAGGENRECTDDEISDIFN